MVSNLGKGLPVTWHLCSAQQDGTRRCWSRTGNNSEREATRAGWQRRGAVVLLVQDLPRGVLACDWPGWAPPSCPR